ncbi:MAG TPA: hemolysin family protein [Chloroflexia bacterium]|nr:hemolysin family protein [Chloroflexia bacterium]
MINLAGLSQTLAQTTVTLPPGYEVCDQRITATRWTVFGLSLLGVLVALTLLWINTAAENALSSLSRHRLQAMKERHEKRGQLAEDLLNRPAQVTATINVLNVICLVLSAALSISAIHQFNLYGIEVTIMVLVLTFLTLSFARAYPKGYALNNPEKVALRLSGFVNVETFVMRPVVWLVGSAANALLRGTGLKPLPASGVATEEEYALLANIGEEEGLIEEEERQMIRSIFQFGDTVVREVMVPRLDIKAIPSTATLEETLDIINSSGKSRLPVYKPDIDHIQGILYAKDVLRSIRLHGQTNFNMENLLRPAYYVPESKKVDQLFAELQQQHVHIAIIVDEYGGTAGLVTIEDLLEEIVGEIQDEYDVEVEDFQRISEDEALVEARLNLGDINEQFHTNWESEDIETIGGFVYDRLGRIPEEGDQLLVDRDGHLLELQADGDVVLDREEYPAEQSEPVHNYYRISVLKVTGQRLRQLRIEHIEITPVIEAADPVDEPRATNRSDGRDRERERKRNPKASNPESDNPPQFPGAQPLSE